MGSVLACPFGGLCGGNVPTLVPCATQITVFMTVFMTVAVRSSPVPPLMGAVSHRRSPGAIAGDPQRDHALFAQNSTEATTRPTTRTPVSSKRPSPDSCGEIETCFVACPVLPQPSYTAQIHRYSSADLIITPNKIRTELSNNGCNNRTEIIWSANRTIAEAIRKTGNATVTLRLQRIVC